MAKVVKKAPPKAALKEESKNPAADKKVDVAEVVVAWFKNLKRDKETFYEALARAELKLRDMIIKEYKK